MKVISFYNSNIDPELVKHQKGVFDHFGIEIEQILTTQSHPEAIDHWLNNNEWDKIAIFDIDCIPLHSNVILDAIRILDSQVLYGAAQRANHIQGSGIYVSPAFCCFTRELYNKVFRISFKETQWHDVGSFFSSEATRVGYSLRLLWPIEVDNPCWDLVDGQKFGHGTNYQNIVYHAFESRFNHESSSRFIQKCKTILNQ